MCVTLRFYKQSFKIPKLAILKGSEKSLPPKIVGRNSHVGGQNIVGMQCEIIQSHSVPSSLSIKHLIMPNFVQMLIQKSNLRLLENTFMSICNLGDSHKLSSSFFGVQVICNVSMVVCFHLCMNTFCVCVCLCVCICVSMCVCVCVCVCTLKGLIFAEINLLIFEYYPLWKSISADIFHGYFFLVKSF